MDIKNTDAIILMQFRDAVVHLKGLSLSDATAGMGLIGRPYFDKLRANGHDVKDAVALLRDVWNSIK